MTPEAQRNALAKALPTIIGLSSSGAWMWRDRLDRWHPCYPENDPLTDLNALHEIERTLLPDDAMYSQQNFYASKLGELTRNDNGRGWKPLSNDDCFKILNAAAEKRAEAVLRILELWED
jgi:hypothetical protein